MFEKLFSKKIRYLHKKLNLKEKEFTKLFWDGDRDKFISRHNTVQNSWLGTKGIDQVKGFYFDEYPISDFKIGDEIAFTKDLFMYESFELFKEQVDVYIQYQSRPKNLFEYKYIYFYDRRKNKIFYSELRVMKKIHEQEYQVELIPPKLYEYKDIEIYKGTLRLNGEYYHIVVKSSFEILTIYFVVGRGYGKKKKINGIGLGLTYDSGLPQATKELMTKEKLTKEEENDFYLIANEMEYIRSDESLYALNSDKKSDYLNQFHKRVDELANYSKKANNLLKAEFLDDIYFSIFDETFQRFHEISKKVESKQDFHVFRRRNAIENFLKNIKKRETTCFIVYPLFGNDTDLFDKTEERCKGFLELNIQLVKDGLKLNRIFVIDNNYIVTKYFIESIRWLRTAGANIKIAWKKDIEKLSIGSYDFVLSEEKDVALYKNIRDKIHIYCVSKNEEEIQSLFFDYERIKEVSFNLELLLSKRDIGDEVTFNLDLLFSKKDLDDDEVLALLVGKWNYYFYGTVVDKMNEFKIWNISIEISSNKTVSYSLDGQCLLKGSIDTTFNQHQVFIKLNSLESNSLSIIIFNKRNIYKNIFKVSMLDKKYGTDTDVATFGIFSRQKLNGNLVKKALGTIDEVILRENIELEKRINELYIESRF